MTPINSNFFNTCYQHARCISLYEFQSYLPTHGQLPYQGSAKKKKLWKKTITEGAFFFPFFLKPILLYHSLL